LKRSAFFVVFQDAGVFPAKIGLWRKSRDGGEGAFLFCFEVSLGKITKERNDKVYFNLRLFTFNFQVCLWHAINAHLGAVNRYPALQESARYLRHLYSHPHKRKEDTKWLMLVIQRGF
jgi:hypothetical protein